MKFFHLSHTDLDGFSCQLITKEYFKEGFFFNANYGLEVKLSIQKILQDIKKFKNEDIHFFITDINLTLQESEELNTSIEALKVDGYKIKLQLLDHHATGEKSAQKYDWYYLDIKRCAAKITYDYMFEDYKGFDKKTIKWLNPLINSVNAIDIWLDNDIENFEFGKVLLSMINKVREINSVLFANLNRDFRLYLLKKASTFIHKKNGNILLDNSIHSLKKEFLKQDKKDDTLDNLTAKYLVTSLNDLKEDLTIYYKEHKGLLTYTLGSISILANAFLQANQDYDFFIDISKKGNASFRAKGNVDVSLMAQKLANGGGHVNASGCKFDDFKETISYEDVKKYIQSKLDKIA